MSWLNYHHLHYFWAVARAGSIAKACVELGLAQPTISAQLRSLERALGQKLMAKVGRNLILTDIGRVVFEYADEIFALGREMQETLSGRPRNRPLRLEVGIADVLPKLVVYRLLEAALALPDPIQLICVEDKPENLLARLSLHELDLVLSDSPVPPFVKVRAFNHLLGECGVVLMGSPALARRYRKGFPASLDGAPLLMPLEATTLRRELIQWFEKEKIRPVYAAEFADSALLKVFGAAGRGLFTVPAVIEAEVCQQYGVEPVGRIETIRERFYAISVERRLKHPAVAAIAETARRDLFS